MVLNIGSTITDGLRRVANRNGLLLAVFGALIGVSWQIAINSVFARLLPADASGSLGVTIDAPLSVLAVVALVAFLLLSYLSVLAMRTFVAGETDRIPSDLRRRRIPWVVANLIVGGIAYGLLTLIGTFLLIVPGIIAYVSLLFTSIYIAVEDENFVSAMVDSWTLTRGHWLRLFLLLVVIIVPVTLVFGLLSFGLALTVGTNSAVSQMVSALLSMPLSIVIIGILAEAFVRLRRDDPPGAF